MIRTVRIESGRAIYSAFDPRTHLTCAQLPYGASPDMRRTLAAPRASVDAAASLPSPTAAGGGTHFGASA